MVDDVINHRRVLVFGPNTSVVQCGGNPDTYLPPPSCSGLYDSGCKKSSYMLCDGSKVSYAGPVPAKLDSSSSSCIHERSAMQRIECECTSYTATNQNLTSFCCCVIPRVSMWQCTRQHRRELPNVICAVMRCALYAGLHNPVEQLALQQQPPPFACVLQERLMSNWATRARPARVERTAKKRSTRLLLARHIQHVLQASTRRSHRLTRSTASVLPPLCVLRNSLNPKQRPPTTTGCAKA